MNTMFDDSSLITFSELAKFLASPLIGTVHLQCSQYERSLWIWERLVRFKYLRCRKKDKSLIVKYMIRMTGLTRKQIGRHAKALRAGKKPRAGPHLTRHHFTPYYNQTDIELLAEVDNATDRLSGGLTTALMKNQYDTGDERFHRIKNISIAHLYRLRGTRVYLSNALNISHTKSTQVPIGIRKKPSPNGSPGYIRVDTVHQGDLNGEKGVYHINFVDEVTQWEIVLAVEGISEQYLLPVLKIALAHFPFIIINFHSDNGSEFINYTVAHLLKKLHIAQTKSRARTSTDNGLVESKNGAIIRKEFGHWHIPGDQAGCINQFYIEHLMPYLNYHRPCHFPMKTQDETTGKITITYPQDSIQTPYQKFLSLNNCGQYLKIGRTLESLKQAAEMKTPLQAAEDKKKARDMLMKLVIPKHKDTIPLIPPPMTL